MEKDELETVLVDASKWALTLLDEKGDSDEGISDFGFEKWPLLSLNLCPNEDHSLSTREAKPSKVR